MKNTKNSFIARLSATALSILLVLGLMAQPIFAAEDSSLPESSTAAESTTTQDTAAQSLFEPDFNISAEAAFIVNEQSGMVVYEKNADTPLTMASLVKMMTCILVMENIPDLDGTTITMESWVNDWLYGKNASTADIRAGETLTVRELLYAMLLPSANEAALMVAGYIANYDLVAFCQMMNTRAAELGCTNTNFADPNGLSEGNITTARDAYYILREFASYPELQEICQTDIYEVAQHEQHTASYNIFTTNRLMVSSSPYYTTYPIAGQAVLAAKTGSLGEWQNFACYSAYEGLSYYSIVLHSPNEADEIAPTIETTSYRPALYETGKLLTWAYTNFTLRAALDTTQAITEIRVLYSTDSDAVKLLPVDNLTTLLPVGTDDTAIIKFFSLPESVEAPVKQGDVIGTVTLQVSGQIIGTSDLIAAKDVERNNTLYWVEKGKQFFSTLYFKLILIAVILLVLIYIVLALLLNKRKRRYKNPYSQKRPRR